MMERGPAARLETAPFGQFEREIAETPTHSWLRSVAETLKRAGFDSADIREDTFCSAAEATIRLSTKHSSEGLDSDRLLLSLPHLPRAEQYEERSADKLMRNLICVAMTRATDNLNVFEMENPQEPALVDLIATDREARARLAEGDAATGMTRERLLLVLFQELGYGRLPVATAIEVDGRAYPVSHLWQQVPIHLVGCGVDLDRRTPGVAGAARMSPHGLVQELLNRSEKHLWGFVSNGLVLRILRDNRSLTRQAYVELDLEGMLEAELYSEFVPLWLLCHQSRVEAQRPEECWLEKWSALGQAEGTRALETLRDGVKDAIARLGAGFVGHPANKALRERLRSGALAGQELYRQVLRLVYRLIFLFVAEDRDALFDPAAPAENRDVYLQHYSVGRLRRLAEQIRGSAHADLYAGLKVVMAALGGRGLPALALPALGSDLWSERSLADLNACELANEALLEAVRALAFTQRGATLWRVDFRNLSSEELGSVYESLLELHPEINVDAGTFEPVVAAGHERKTTGSYYTPRGLVQSLLDTALEPVLDQAVRGSESERALLALRIADPACGSGHFLVPAAHRVARRLAGVRTGDEEPSPAAMRTALRDVIGHCLYGVDLNPMAVELCKVSLWMEALEPGRPLSFLDSHILCGNSLLGATPELMEKGIPQEAFTVLTGDDKKEVAAQKKRNKEELLGHRSLTDWTGRAWEEGEEVLQRFASLGDLSDTTLEGVKLLESQYHALVDDGAYLLRKLAADAWCAAFVWPRRAGGAPALTQDVFARLMQSPESVPSALIAEVQRLAEQYRFFHWYLAFPEVFARGGFDCVLGNPPWERIKLQEAEFFAERVPEIAKAANAAARKKLIAALPDEDPALYAAFQAALREAEGESQLIREGGRYPLCGRGDINTYSIFAELARSLIAEGGRAGLIVPSGIATDDTTKHFFGELIEASQLHSLYSFENEEKIFPSVHHEFKFCLLTLRRDEDTGDPRFAFFLRQPSQVGDSERQFSLASEDFALLNPNTRTCPIFRSKRDAELTRAIYKRVPVLIKEGPPEENPWQVSFMAMFHMANDSGLFRGCDQLAADGFVLEGNRFRKGGSAYLPLYEAKMIHQFDHRFGTYEGQTQAQGNQGKLPELDDAQHADTSFLPIPRYWVAQAEVDARLAGRWDRGWLMGWRDITNAVVYRTVIASVLPRVAAGHKLPLVMAKADAPTHACLLANLNSFVLDYVARQKLGGTSLTYFVLKQLPVLSPAVYEGPCPWDSHAGLRDWLLPRVLELVYTAHDVKGFAAGCGYDGPSFGWDPERRFQLRCELDAAFFHLYGIIRDDVGYIMDTFPIVRRHDEERFGEFRTKRVILENYDLLACRSKSGSRGPEVDQLTERTAMGASQ